jgi:hypothetical protein
VTELIIAIHQETAIEQLQQVVAKTSPERLLIATTHLPFPKESEELMQLAPEVRLLTFSDLLSDAEMARCDEEARQRGLVEAANMGRRHYFTFFTRMNRHLKNVIV